MSDKGPKPYHEATSRTPARNGPLPGEWRETKYPGDAAVNLDVTRDGEIGMIRIQVYGPESYMVASYTPGYETSSPGDTPKFNPDKVVWCEAKGEADRQFVAYVIGAFRAGWKPEKPNGAIDRGARERDAESARMVGRRNAGASSPACD